VITRRDRPLAVGQTPACLTSDALELEARSPSTVAVSSFVGASTALEVAVRLGLKTPSSAVIPRSDFRSLRSTRPPSRRAAAHCRFPGHSVVEHVSRRYSVTLYPAGEARSAAFIRHVRSVASACVTWYGFPARSAALSLTLGVLRVRRSCPCRRRLSMSERNAGLT